jgi:hypothetical protein
MRSLTFHWVSGLVLLLAGCQAPCHCCHHRAACCCCTTYCAASGDWQSAYPTPMPAPPSSRGPKAPTYDPLGPKAPASDPLGR